MCIRPPAIAPSHKLYLNFFNNLNATSPITITHAALNAIVGKTQAVYPPIKSANPAPKAPATAPFFVPRRHVARIIMQSPKCVYPNAVGILK